jgi:CMP-N-acetylneuraminic acid synthetase
MSSKRSLSLETYRQAAEFLRIGNRAVRKAQMESRRRKVPNVYSHNGTLYYELPDGRLTTVDPFGDRGRR